MGETLITAAEAALESLTLSPTAEPNRIPTPKPDTVATKAIPDSDMTINADPLVALPADAVHIIFSHLDVKDILVAECVSSAWRAFSLSNTSLWSAIAKRLGVDLLEWKQADRERKFQAAHRASANPEPVAPDHPTDEEVQNDHGRKPMTQDVHQEAEVTIEVTAAEYRSASVGHLQLQKAWFERQFHEVQITTPAFKLRQVAIDHSEDTIYALTDNPTERTDELLVFNRYTGQLLVTIPWIVKGATISVGAGYVVVSSIAGPDRDEEGWWGIVPDPVGLLHVYRTAKAAERAAHLAKRNGLAPLPPFKHERGLPLEFFTTISALKDCPAFKVKLDRQNTLCPQAVVAGATGDKVVLCHLDDGLRIEEIPTSNVMVIDAPSPANDVDRGYIVDINFDEQYLFVVTNQQCHVFNRRTRTKVTAFLDPNAERVTQAAISYYVPYGFPFSCCSQGVGPTNTSNSPIPLAATSMDLLKGWRADTQPDDFEGERYQNDDFMTGDVRSVILTERDLILLQEQSGVLVVRDYRKVLGLAQKSPPEERLAVISARSAFLTFEENVEELQAYGSRLFAHSVILTIFCFDLDNIPDLPLPHEDDLPDVSAFVFDISVVEGMMQQTSIAVDARGVYLADWDKGYGDDTLDYGPLHQQHVNDGSWPKAVRPNWGSIKLWTARAESQLGAANHARVQRALAVHPELEHLQYRPPHMDVDFDARSSDGDPSLVLHSVFTPPYDMFSDTDSPYAILALFDAFDDSGLGRSRYSSDEDDENDEDEDDPIASAVWDIDMDV